MVVEMGSVAWGADHGQEDVADRLVPRPGPRGPSMRPKRHLVTAGIYCIDVGFAPQWQGMRLHHRVSDRPFEVERVELSPSTFAAEYLDTQLDTQKELEQLGLCTRS